MSSGSVFSTFVWYNHSGGGSSDYAWLPGHWMSDMEPPGEGSMFYQDAFGVQVVAGDFAPQAPMKRLPEYLVLLAEIPDANLLSQNNDLNQSLARYKELVVDGESIDFTISWDDTRQFGRSGSFY